MMNFTVCMRFAFALLMLGMLFQFALDCPIPAVILYGVGAVWTGLAMYAFVEDEK